jgi:hypothetical protein
VLLLSLHSLGVLKEAHLLREHGDTQPPSPSSGRCLALRRVALADLHSSIELHAVVI